MDSGLCDPGDCVSVVVGALAPVILGLFALLSHGPTLPVPEPPPEPVRLSHIAHPHLTPPQITHDSTST